MSKELVINATSHERRVAIMEEGQLVEIYIEREKEFALVGSIYKGKVTRVLPGMQSAFVDIGLDGDAFLYVSDVFENLEDYEHGQSSEQHAPRTAVPAIAADNGSPVELLPGESLSRAAERHTEPGEEPHHEEFHPQSPAEHGALSSEEPPVSAGDSAQQSREPSAGEQLSSAEGQHAESGEERQPDSNASAPQNFSPRFNPTQNYPRRSNDRNDRQGQNYGRGGDRNRGGGRWGRRGGRNRGGRPQGGPGGRNLPPSKYASPQGGEFRGYDNRGGQQRGYDNRRQEGPRSTGPSPADIADEAIVLPGESLAKYRDKPVASPSPAPVVEQEPRIEPVATEEHSPRPANSLPIANSGSAGAPRRSSGGLPSWLLADAGTEAAAEAAPSET